MANTLKHTTHAVNSWHNLLRRTFVDVPKMIEQTQSHRAALNRLLAKHGGR